MPEPLVLDRLAAWGYALAGGEYLTIPRVLSALFWCAGAWFLFAAARTLAGAAGALIAVSVYLFLPYALRASVSIQPDPLAVMWMCAGIWGLVRFARNRGSSALVAAALLGAAAIFVRPLTALFLFPVLGTVLFGERRPSSERLRQALMYLALTATPTVLFILPRLLAGDAMGPRLAATFAPAFLLDTDFWRGWARNAWMAFGVLFAAAFVSAVFVAKDRLRIHLAALWLGYVVYGLFFNLHVATHPYYQTIAVPAVALSLASLGPYFERRSSGRWSSVPGILVAVFLLAIAAFAGTFRSPEPQPTEVYRAIGEAVGHSRRVIFSTPDWGTPLRYYADIGGAYWPATFEVDMYRPLGSAGIPMLSPADRLEMLGRKVGGAEFFVVAPDPAAFERDQPELKALLERSYRVLAREPRYVIYDLRR